MENDPVLCQSKGSPRCGICDCNEGQRGQNCQCSTTGTDLAPDIDDSACQMGNTSAICSSRLIFLLLKLNNKLCKFYTAYHTKCKIYFEIGELVFVGNVSAVQVMTEIRYT